MPPDRRAPLRPSEVYALTAFLLFANDDVGRDDIIDAGTLPQVTMPGLKSFELKAFFENP